MNTVRSETLTVTPQMAGQWLAHSMYARQRKRAEWHVKRLTMEMEKGRFIVGTQIHFGVLGGKLHLVNGQHTLAAIERSGVPIELTILYTTAQTEDDLGHLYGRHDRHRGRTPHDAFLGMGLSQKLNLSEQEVNAFGAGLKYVLNGFRVVSIGYNIEIATSLDYLSDAMLEWSPVAGLYFDQVREARHGMKAAFRRAPVVAVGLATMKHKREKAMAFWSGAVLDDGLHRSDPRRALNQFLLTNSSGYGDTITYIRNVAGAWNKFYADGQLSFLRPGDSGKIGVTIRGTPYKAERRKGATRPVDDAGDPPDQKPEQPTLPEEARP